MNDTVPHLTYSPSTSGEREREILSAAKAARALDLHPSGVQKLIDSGYLPTPYADIVHALAARRYIETSSPPVFVIQTSKADPIVDDVNIHAAKFHDENRARAAIDDALQANPGEWRIATGDSPNLPDLVWVDAARGDWHNITPDPNVRYILIVLATFVTGVLRIRDDEEPEPFTVGTQRKYRFPATLLGRLAPASLPGEAPLLGERVTYGSDTTKAERAFVDAAIGRRIYPRRGVQAFRLE